jgi:hypothetical protein
MQLVFLTQLRKTQTLKSTTDGSISTLDKHTIESINVTDKGKKDAKTALTF